MHFPRSSGVLLHPTALPGPYGSGDLGPSAYHFIDWLVVAGQKIWQILPFGPTDFVNSPYASLSAFAGNPMLVSLEELKSKGWLSEIDLQNIPEFSKTKIEYDKAITYRTEKLKIASANFFSNASSKDKKGFDRYCEKNASWLNDYSLFMALFEKYKGKEWCEWDERILKRKRRVLAEAEKELADGIQYNKFIQWCFHNQWMNLRKYAHEKGITIFGDIPIFVAYQSADVWSNQELFSLDGNGKLISVAGVPPDYFSKTGQRWGNPLYKWNVVAKKGYEWWIRRIQHTLSFVDILRIDHFRGFVQHWEIPASEKTAIIGKWKDGPGEKLFDAVQKKLGELPIIAEDLGVITPDVIALRDSFSFPGMKILQFAFVSGPDSPFLPHNYSPNCVVYTGTHDNDTTVGWFKKATEREKSFFLKYCGSNGLEVHWDLIRLASQSVANIAIFPFQDVLGQDSFARVNYPGKTYGNWEYRFSWDEVHPHHADRLYEISALSNRCESNRLSIPSYPQGKSLP
jgi:4-alpha-glucanotransferase